VYYIRTLLLSYEIARFVFGQAGVYLGQDFDVLAIGIKLL